jgi:hypothetical protein
MRNSAHGWRHTTKCLCVGASLLAFLPVACHTPIEKVEKVEADPVAAIDVAVYRRAEVDRIAQLKAETERLRADLRQAEEALVLAESGLRGSHSRADAVSSLAEAKIQVERAANRAPWRPGSIAEARGKLSEADHQVEQGHFGAALFFVYRASRIAELLEREATMVRDRPGTLYVRAGRVNLRAGPSTSDDVVGILSGGTPVFPERTKALWMLVRVASGSVGWVHRDLLRSE